MESINSTFFEYQRKASGLIEKPSLERRKEALMSQRWDNEPEKINEFGGSRFPGGFN